MKSPLLLLGCLGLLSALAQAQEKAPAQPPPPANPREECKADMQNFCASVRPGHGRMRQCLNQHKNALSATCREALLKSAPKQPAPKKPGTRASPTST